MHCATYSHLKDQPDIHNLQLSTNISFNPQWCRIFLVVPNDYEYLANIGWPVKPNAFIECPIFNNQSLGKCWEIKKQKVWHRQIYKTIKHKKLEIYNLILWCMQNCSSSLVFLQINRYTRTNMLKYLQTCWHHNGWNLIWNMIKISSKWFRDFNDTFMFVGCCINISKSLSFHCSLYWKR